MLDLRLPFGWTGSPGFFFFSRALLDFVRSKRPSDYPLEVLHQLGELLAEDKAEPPGLYPIFDPPHDPDARPIDEQGDAFFYAIRIFIDDFLALCLALPGSDRPAAMAAAILDGAFQLFGHRASPAPTASRPPSSSPGPRCWRSSASRWTSTSSPSPC